MTEREYKIQLLLQKIEVHRVTMALQTEALKAELKPASLVASAGKQLSPWLLTVLPLVKPILTAKVVGKVLKYGLFVTLPVAGVVYLRGRSGS